MTFEEILTRFHVTKRNGDQCLAKCPAHKDDKASLQIGRGRDGKTVLKCMAMCDTSDVLRAVGLTMRDIMGDDAQQPASDWKRYLEGALSRGGARVRIVDRYDYRFADGSYAFTKVRTDPKSFRYGKIVNERWCWETVHRKNINPALFTPDIGKLTEAVRSGERVFITEGEKDVRTMTAQGYIAVTMGGANDWDDRYAEIFAGGNVIILGDNDPAGRAFAETIRRDIENVTGSVRTVYPSAKEKGDVTDFFEDGGTKDDFETLIESGTEAPIDLTQFHIQTKTGWKVNRNAIAEYIVKNEHIVIIGDIPYVYDGGIYRRDRNGCIIMTKAKNLMFPDLRDPSHMMAVFKMISTDSKLIISPDTVNRQPPSWICFENGYWNPIDKRMERHDPKYVTINMLPHRYAPKTYERSLLDEFLEYSIPSEETREMVLEYCGLCMTCDTRQQKMLILDGPGGTGKSTIIGLTVRAIGSENVSNVSLGQLSDHRFAAYDMYHKLMNSCADIDNGSVQNVSVIKQLTGEDKLRGEAKGKDAISFSNYAKIMFSVNGLPIIQGERSDGFFRRVLIAEFDRKPLKQDKGLSGRLEENIDAFIHKCVNALERMYERGDIFESERSKNAVRQWRMDGDSVEAWICDRTYRIPGVKTDRRILYEHYQQYCHDNERTEVSASNFYKALRSKQYTESTVHGDRYFVGISLTAAVKVPEAFKDLIGRRITD